MGFELTTSKTHDWSINMAFRQAVKPRKGVKSKYAGIYEYFSDKDADKATLSYYVAIRDSDGKVYKLKTDAKDKDEALKILNDKKSNIRQEKSVAKKSSDGIVQKVRHGSLTFDDMAELFYANRAAQNNHKDKQRYYNHLSPIIGKQKVSKFTTDDAMKLQKELSGKTVTINPSEPKKPMAAKTIDNIIDQLKAMFNEGMRYTNRWCTHNPVADKDVKKLTSDDDKTRLRIFTDGELSILWERAANHPRMNLLLKLLYHTAARPEAIIELQVKDIDFRHNRIHLKAMKHAKAYTIPMIEDVKTILTTWINEHELKREHYIFYPIQTGDKNKPAIYENFRRAAKSIIDPVFNDKVPTHDRKNRATLYTLRHTAATKLVQKLGIKVAKEYLNHSDLKVTEIYAKVVDSQMMEAANAL
jgi:integrase